MTNKSYDGARYSTLTLINAGNVAGLKAVCTYNSGSADPAQSSPVLYNDRLYVSVGQLTVAVEPTTCREIWRYDWVLKGKALSVTNRGVAIKDGLLVRGTPDGFLIALDMADGSLKWQRQITSAEESHYLSMPPMIVGDAVIYGTAGADWGGQGWIGAFKLANGEEIWRYNVLPAGETGGTSWESPASIAHGGGSFWTPVAVDRASNLVFVPIGNPAPDFFGSVRPGDNAHTNSMAVLDITTGKPQWVPQYVAHDVHDWDLSQTSPLLSAEIKGRQRNIVVVSGKDGRMRIVDRDSHETLFDIALVKQENSDAPVTVEGVHICPGLLGGQEWSSSAYDATRHIVISPLVNWCGTEHLDPAVPVHKPGEHYYGGKIVQDPIDQAQGILSAVDVSIGTVKWKMENQAPMLANVTATAGGIAFAGDLKGTLFAVSSDDGRVLLRYNLGSSAGGGMISYAINGKQYLAAVSGPVSAFFPGGTGQTSVTVLALP
jgi:alcohol dehydrogenase (cytochrome c)